MNELTIDNFHLKKCCDKLDLNDYDSYWLEEGKLIVLIETVEDYGDDVAYWELEKCPHCKSKIVIYETVKGRD
jgi:hypothetical protein